MPASRFAAAALGATLLLAPAACTQSSPSPLAAGSQSLAAEQALRVRLALPPRSLDPALVQDDRETAVVRQFSEPLLKPAPDGLDTQPAAAESLTVSADGLTYTFRLRANGRWSDGRPVLASQFVAAWRRLIDPRTAAPHAELFAAVIKGGEAANSLDPRDDAGRLQPSLDNLGLAAPDEATFVLVLPRPLSYARWVATLPEGGPYRPDSGAGAVGNGPFRVSETAAGRTTLAANPNYWGGRPTLSTIVMSYSADAQAAGRAYGTGALDVVTGVPAPAPTGIADIGRSTELTTFWMSLNVERVPLDNARLRQAIAMSVDRQALVNEAMSGLGQPATTLIPPGMRGYRPEAGRSQEFNPSAARELLDQSGVPRDQLVALPLLVADRPLDRALADVFAAQVSKVLGVSFLIQPVDDAEFGRRVRAGDFAVAGPAGWSADYGDQANFYALFRSDNGNDWSRWRNQQYDALVAAAVGETDSARADALFNQALQLLESASPAVFLANRVAAAAVKPYVKGVRPAPGDEFPGATYSNLIYIANH